MGKRPGCPHMGGTGAGRYACSGPVAGWFSCGVRKSPHQSVGNSGRTTTFTKKWQICPPMKGSGAYRHACSVPIAGWFLNCCRSNSRLPGRDHETSLSSRKNTIYEKYQDRGESIAVVSCLHGLDGEAAGLPTYETVWSRRARMLRYVFLPDNLGLCPRFASRHGIAVFAWLVAIPPRSQVFHAVSVWLVRCQPRPFGCLLVCRYPLVGRTPVEFDRNSRPSPVGDSLLRGCTSSRGGAPSFGSLLGHLCRWR
jgi:hypothetical protein